MTALYLTAIAVLAVALAVTLRANRNLIRDLKAATFALGTERAVSRECQRWLADCMNARDLPAYVYTEHDMVAGTHFFTVYRQVKTLPGHRLPIRRYRYDPSDADDTDYKRMHAREVADAINEKP